MNNNVFKINDNFYVRHANGQFYLHRYSDNVVVASCEDGISFKCVAGFIVDSDADYCDSNFITSVQLPDNYYLWTQVNIPPSSSYNDLCNEISPTYLNVSDKIKITIFDDPIFSGVYVFDRVDGTGNSNLFSPNWVLNSGESSHNLSTYSHPGSIFDENLLVSLNDDMTSPGATVAYEGYTELKISYSNDSTNVGDIQLEDAYAFPAKFVFTAVQPPCPCSGDPSLPEYIATTGIGHRLAVGFVPPIRYRHTYGDWILVDKIPHIVTGTPNYVIGSLFNNGYQATNGMYLNTSAYVSYTESTTGIPPTPIGTGFINIIGGEGVDIRPVCTDIPNIGFAFKVSATGLGYDRGTSLYIDSTSNIQGIGRLHTYERYYDFDLNIRDERPFFGPKTPVVAAVEFVYSCRPLKPGECLFPTAGSSSVSSGFSPCLDASYNKINKELLCPDTYNPTSSIWIENNISGINVIYSGAKVGTQNALLAIKNNLVSSGTYYNLYTPTDNNNDVINIAYTGHPANLKTFISDSIHSFLYTSGLDITNLLSPITSFNLYYQIDGGSATAKIVPEIDADGEVLDVYGAGSPYCNGWYQFNDFGASSLPMLQPYQKWEMRYVARTGVYSWELGPATSGSSENDWAPHYRFRPNNGYDVQSTYNVPATPPMPVNSVNGISTGEWIIDPPCFSGIAPPPSSIMLRELIQI